MPAGIPGNPRLMTRDKYQQTLNPRGRNPQFRPSNQTLRPPNQNITPPNPYEPTGGIFGGGTKGGKYWVTNEGPFQTPPGNGFMTPVLPTNMYLGQGLTLFNAINPPRPQPVIGEGFALGGGYPSGRAPRAGQRGVYPTTYVPPATAGTGKGGGGGSGGGGGTTYYDPKPPQKQWSTNDIIDTSVNWRIG